MLHLGHLEAGQLGAVALALAVALLRLVLEDLDLLAALVAGDLRLDLDLLEVLGREHRVVVGAEHDRAQRRPWRPRRRAAGRRAGTVPFSTRYCLPPLSTIAYVGIRGIRSRSRSGSGVVAGAEPLPARERRRPPLRPRRRGPDSRPSAASPSAASASGTPSTSVATARGALDALDPDQLALADQRRRAGDRDHERVDPGDRVAGVVHVRLLDRDQHLVAEPRTAARAARSPRESPDSATSKVVDRQRVAALEEEVLPVSSSSSSSPLSWRISSRATFGLTRIRCASASGLAVDDVAQLAQHLDRDRLGRARRRPRRRRSGSASVRISRTPSVTFWRVISTSPSGETSTT